MKCSHCGAEFEGKFCPECGTKAEAEKSSSVQGNVRSEQQKQSVFNEIPQGIMGKKKKKGKKPIYKRGWFIFLVIIIAIGIYASATGNKGNKGSREEKIDWSTIILKDMIPEPPSKQGHLFENSDEELNVDLDKVTDEQYNKYMNDCIDKGFDVDADKSSFSYEAYNSEGYSLKLSHYSDNIDITLKAPIKFETINWPSGKAGNLLPVPKSTTGKFNYEHDTNFSVYIGETSKADYDEYVMTCADKGFNVDYDKGEKYYRADNTDGYHVSVSYEGNNIMLISINEPNDADTNADTSSSSETENADSTTTTPTEQSESTQDSNVGSDGLRTDFKEAMDSYESFMNEYCDFMEKYNANPSDATLLVDYATYMGKYSDFANKFDKWESEDLNDAELTYYIDVQSRVSKRLLEVGQ